MTAVIVCNGSIKDYSYYEKYLSRAKHIICVDGGSRHLRNLGYTPDVLLGDFDSISASDLKEYRDMGVEILKYPPEKDMTDTELAVEYTARKGYKDVIILGALGTRFDHSLSNVLILKKMHDNGIKGVIINEYNEIQLISDRITLDREDGVKVTLLPLTEKVEGVTTKGLKYPLKDATIYLGSSWGVSNEFEGDVAEVSIRKGLLFVIKSKD